MTDDTKRAAADGPMRKITAADLAESALIGWEAYCELRPVPDGVDVSRLLDALSRIMRLPQPQPEPRMVPLRDVYRFIDQFPMSDEALRGDLLARITARFGQQQGGDDGNG